MKICYNFNKMLCERTFKQIENAIYQLVAFESHLINTGRFRTPGALYDLECHLISDFLLTYDQINKKDLFDQVNTKIIQEKAKKIILIIKEVKHLNRYSPINNNAKKLRGIQHTVY